MSGTPGARGAWETCPRCRVVCGYDPGGTPEYKILNTEFCTAAVLCFECELDIEEGRDTREPA